MNRKKLILSCLLLAVLALAVGYRFSEVRTVHRQGLWYLEHSGQYERQITELDARPEVILDLQDLAANIGLPVYDDGQCRITLTAVRRDDYGGYLVDFQAQGDYDYQGGRLVTPLSPERVQGADGGLITSVGQQDYVVKNWVVGGSLVEPDGDVYSYQLFPTTCYEGDFALNDEIAAAGGQVRIQLTGLKEVVYTRK